MIGTNVHHTSHDVGDVHATKTQEIKNMTQIDHVAAVGAFLDSGSWLFLMFFGACYSTSSLPSARCRSG